MTLLLSRLQQISQRTLNKGRTCIKAYLANALHFAHRQRFRNVRTSVRVELSSPDRLGLFRSLHTLASIWLVAMPTPQVRPVVSTPSCAGLLPPAAPQPRENRPDET
jgi:hypothetical protein